MGRTYQSLLNKAEELELEGNPVWDLEDQARRLGLVLYQIPIDARDWDRAVSGAFRRAALRAHPDKFPAAERERAEEAFKLLNDAHTLMLKVGKAVREEVEGGGAGEAERLRQRAHAEAEERKRRKLEEQLGMLTCLDGMNPVGQDELPTKCITPSLRTSLDLQQQFWGILANCEQDVIKAARRRRRWRWFRRILFGAAAVAALWMWRSKNLPEDDKPSREEILEAAREIRRELRKIARKVAAEMGDPSLAPEIADMLDQALRDGSLQFGSDGSLRFTSDDDDDGEYEEYESHYAGWMGLGRSEGAEGAAGTKQRPKEDGVVYCGGGQGRVVVNVNQGEDDTPQEAAPVQ
ncbi:hypothetical protein CYMTET_17321 [Cymbomonas tetramitiformis]|uniref:J domain-containing protein n=1 Tax=Cymbomonas tetramitiformis TaxID=36881 RepID=A0AAE0GA45_9CHLO|nr:hypothetical protein CYMTET_17321 [Cymbomonas tetramitiformis]|eukprot:gene15716-18637_t